MTGDVHERVARVATTGSLRCAVVVVMGVSGSGKTTVSEVMAQHLGMRHLDADDFHPRSNIDKMRAGTPLTDADRLPWLRRLHEELDRSVHRGESVVLACSALKRSYRDVLRGDLTTVGFVHLRVRRQELAERLTGRSEHFFPATLVDSQLATLQEPESDEPALIVEATDAPERIVERVAESWSGGE